MNLLLTGSTGFVGRNLLLHALKDPKFSAIILPVRNKTKLLQQLEEEGIERLPEHLHLCLGDEHSCSLEKVPSPDIAIHCAGLTFSRHRADYFKTNVKGSLTLLNALPENCRLLVLSSQSAAGPTPALVRARTREHREEPHSWYGESKLAMEKNLFQHAGGRLLILRPPMILGPRDSATVPLFQMARGFLRMKPGFQIKHYSWIAVDDLCRAILITAKSDWQKLPHHNYFVASNETITDLSLIQTTADVVGARGITLRLPHVMIQWVSLIADKIPSLHKPLQSLGRDRVKEILPQRWVADGSEFQRDFDWKPQKSLLKTLEETARWLKVKR
ncbi:MAG: NAD(P)-dependent oxidoreductase [Verrucomicrobiae bacterium]|nr:NAD(P)-dependent oxidoreductase [Verrucomicrobiae bacterium]